MNKSIFISIKKIPDEIIDDIKNVISHYSTGLLLLDADNNYSNVASGTFVSVRDRPAILTARHVINEIKNSENNLGLNCSQLWAVYVYKPHIGPT